MPASPKVNLETLVAALQPIITQTVSEAVAAALAASQPTNLSEAVEAGISQASAKQKKARQDSKRRRKAQGSKNLPAFPKGFVKGASFTIVKANGSESQHRIVSIEDGVAKTRGLTGFQGTWKSTTIIAMLQTKSVRLVEKPKASSKRKAA